jgi:hypothetical protein
MILLIAYYSFCFSQFEVPRLAQPRYDSFYYFFKPLRDLRKTSKLVICYRQYSYWNVLAGWEIISVSDSNKLRKFTSDVELEILTPVKIGYDSLVTQIKLFYDNEIFTIINSGCCFRSQSGTGCDTLYGESYDGPEFDFLLITKKQIMQLYYYSPTPCDDERRRVLNIINGLWKR